jgi:dTDP-4-amino-4,6-dideoxygalactose transaminase
MISSANPDISEREIEAVSEALRSGTLSTGEVVSKFESESATLIGCNDGAAVCSGGVALELAFAVSDIEPGDGVIVSPRNCAAVLYPILRQDLVPVFADIEPQGHNIDPQSVSEVVRGTNQSIGAVLATHLHGNPCRIRELMSITDENDLTLIEDICQAPGATVGGDPIGSFGSLAVCSFGATKNITTAEGGMVVSNDERRIAEIRHRRSSRHGAAVRPLRSVRMSDVEAAMGRAQLQRYDMIVAQRRSIAETYQSQLADVVGLPRPPEGSTSVRSNYPVLVDRPDHLRSHLAEEGIESNTYDALLHEYDCLSDRAWTAGDLSNAKEIRDQTVVLPLHSKLTHENATAVIDAVREFCK